MTEKNTASVGQITSNEISNLSSELALDLRGYFKLLQDEILKIAERIQGGELSEEDFDNEVNRLFNG